MFGWTIEVSTCAYTYLHVPPALHHLYLHSIPMMCASLSCPSSSGSQADRQNRQTNSSALASPLRSSADAENENGPSFFPALPFFSLPFPPVDELDLTCFVWALPQNVIICVIVYPWMRERASTPHYLTCIT